MHHQLLWAALLLAACSLPAAAQAQSNLHLTATDDPDHPHLREAVLFPFDRYSVPFRHGLELTLISGHKEGVVLRPGPAKVVNTASLSTTMPVWIPSSRRPCR
jgi:hypothetical protein